MLLGSSGVGKSTLVNRWVGRELMPTKETRVDDDEGRHTTTHRELIVLPGGGVVIDTPGIRELQLWGGGVEEAFADVEEFALRCRFNDCSHSTNRLRRAGGGRGRQRWRRAPRELAQAPAGAPVDRNPPGPFLLRKEESRKWKLIAKEGRAKARRV